MALPDQEYISVDWFKWIVGGVMAIGAALVAWLTGQVLDRVRTEELAAMKRDLEQKIVDAKEEIANAEQRQAERYRDMTREQEKRHDENTARLMRIESLLLNQRRVA